MNFCETYRVRWVVFGNTGMFGLDMIRTIESHGHSALGLNRSHFQIGSSESLLTTLADRADVIINAVAYTAVDAAEDSPGDAMLVNANFAEKLSRVAAHIGSRFMQISTDYVFSGRATSPMGVDFRPEPISAYGRSKLAGEEAVSASGANYTIFRTSWLYGSQGSCFPKTIQKRLIEGGRVGVVDDQFGQPTWTRDLAEVVFAHGLVNFEEPIVHAVSSGNCTWYEFALEIQEGMPHVKSSLVYPIKSEDLKFKALRPAYSVLDNHLTAGPIISHWRSRWLMAKDEVLSGFEQS